MATYRLADTSVISRLTKVSRDSDAYNGMLGNHRLAISFQTRAELLGAGFGPARKKRVDDYLASVLRLPHSEATDVWYARVTETRKDLKRQQQPGGDASDADVWIISSTLEHGLSLMSHDVQQVHLARRMGVRTFTNLSELRDDNPLP